MIRIMKYSNVSDEISEVLSSNDKKIVINTINPHSYVVSLEDDLFDRALRDADILVPDGEGVIIANKILNKTPLRKVAGYDVHSALLNKMSRESGRVFYLGATTDTLDKIRTKNNRYKTIVFEYYSPPFTEIFSDGDNADMVSVINEFKPDVLFIGMTAPKQEKWLYQNKDVLDFKFAACIGAVFDFYVGNVKRAPDWLIKLKLEWLFRFVQQPKRLWRRVFVSSYIFFKEVFKYKISNFKEQNN